VLPVGILLGLLPVLLFLGGLLYIDSYKLVHFPAVLSTIAVGAASAVLAIPANGWLLSILGLQFSSYSRYVSPVVEETLKAIFLVYLLKSNKVGFSVDAAIRGFAIGAGFALVENLYYFHFRPDASPSLWIIRGFGTAVMHGGATSLVGILSKEMADRRGSASLPVFLPGILLATALHSFFNHFLLSPFLSTLLILLLLPSMLLLVFRRSERATRDWLGIGFDSDRELLEMITTGTLQETRIGSYLHSLQDRFAGETVADMLCYLRLHLELSIRAKGMLLMREAGFHVPPDREVQEQFAELAFLEKSIGRTGKIALHPFLHTRSKDLWQITMLQ
jgi:RsiW-degrading membrane proteinase PrsW (M82 family)